MTTPPAGRVGVYTVPVADTTPRAPYTGQHASGGPLWVEEILGVELSAEQRGSRTVTATGGVLQRVREALPVLDEAEDVLAALGGGHDPLDPAHGRSCWEHLARWHHMCPADVVDARSWGWWHSECHGRWAEMLDDPEGAYLELGHRPHTHRRA